MKTLKELFLSELADIHDAEQRIAKALLKMAKAATTADRIVAFEVQLSETEDKISKLKQVFQCFDEKPKGRTCKATVGLLEEGEEIAANFKGSPAINAALISAAQKVEHYEMASYGWASLLEHEEAAGLLQEILDKETATNEPLSELPMNDANEKGLAEGERRKEVAPASKKSRISKKPFSPRSPHRKASATR